MIKIQLLEPFATHRTIPPVIMPESTENRRKFEAFMMIAPDIESEFKYLANNKIYSFRFLSKYFIDKRWDHSFYGAGRKVIKLNTEGDVTELLTKYHHGALRNIDEVTSYLPTVKTRVLKNFNVLVECNYATQMILENAKDRRLMSVKAKECLNEYIRVFQSADKNSSASNYLGDYDVHMIIPMDLWFTREDYANPSALMKANSKHFMGQILRLISDPNTLAKFNKIYLVHGEYVLVLDKSTMTEGMDQESIEKVIKRFMTKVKNLDTTPDEPEAVQKIQEAENQTKEDLVVDKVAEQLNADPDDKEVRAAVKKVVQKNVKPEQVTTISKNRNEETDLPSNTLTDGIEDIDVNVDAIIQDPEDVDNLLAAKAEGKSIQSYKRDQVLKQKYRELSIGGVPITSIMEAEKNYEIPTIKPQAHTVNPDMKEIRSASFEAAYNKNVMQEDLVNILMHFSHVQPAMYLNKDIEVVDISTPTDRIIRYTVQFEDENRKRHKFSFKLPKMYEDRYLFLNDQKMNISHQKLPFPVTKVSPNKCQAVTNYNKIFTERYGSNLSPRVTKIKKIFSGPNCPRIAKVTAGDSTILNKNYLTTVEYDELGSAMTKMELGGTKDNTKIFFVVDDARAAIDIRMFEKTKFENDEVYENMLPLAVRRGAKSERYCISSRSNLVYDTTGKCYDELSQFIVTAAGWYDSKIESEFDQLSAGTKFVYSRSKVMAKDVPTILVCAAADPGGLIAVLEKAQIKYTFTEKRPSDINKDTQAVVAFSDGYLVYDRYPYENSLLLNGLNTFPTKNYSFYEMNTYDAYVQIFDTMFGSKGLIDGLRNFYYMFVDPITMDVLIKLKMPTDFTRLMLYCNDVLADNSYQIDSDYHNSRIRSNEIIMARLYYELAEAWGYYRLGKTDTFSIPEDCVIKYLLTSNVVDPHSELNVVLEMENDRLIKLKGPSGMNEDHSFTIEKRAYHPSMTGIIGINTTPSGEVGIGRHMVLNCNIDDARGFITLGKDDYSGSELATPGELMQAFGPESADIERVAMEISQSKHIVPVADSCSSPVSYDMERIVPYISNDFARTAKNNGKVVSIENNVMIIKYDDGTIDDVDLGPRPAKNTDGGFYIMNQMTTNLVVGNSVSKGQIIAYDPKYINNNDLFGDPLASMGTMARIAIETNGGVYEDSCYITDGLAHRMATKITRQKRVILSKYANIKHMVQPGYVISANQPLITFDDTADEFTSQMLAAMADEIGDSDEVIASNAPVLSKYSGRIVDVQIFYTADPNEMTPSLRKIVNNYVKEVHKREKTISEYESIYDANTLVKTSERLVPDSQGKVKGVKLPDGVMIDFYIEYDDVMAPGDKLSFYSAVKGVVSNIIPDDLAPYSAEHPDVKIDACLSAIGIYKRMTLDVVKLGLANKIVIERKRQLKEKYQSRIKAELDKLKK